jgi:hypothetical protein
MACGRGVQRRGVFKPHAYFVRHARSLRQKSIEACSGTEGRSPTGVFVSIRQGLGNVRRLKGLGGLSSASIRLRFGDNKIPISGRFSAYFRYG